MVFSRIHAVHRPGIYRLLSAGVAAIAIGHGSPVRADEPAIDFELASAKDAIAQPPNQNTASGSRMGAIAQPSPIQDNALNFGLTQTKATPYVSSDVTLVSHSPNPSLDQVFEGGSDSLVARAVGSAEGTRTPEGYRNPAYYGHVDPGNGAWNLGSFSYQHGARSPEEADFKQLRRLQQQADVIQAKAVDRGLQLSLEEQLNGIDLANQAPLAALDRGGYIDWLDQARQLGLQGADAVLWARTRSFLDPDTRQWNAPGLGNSVQQISHDQERRMHAIAKAIDVYQQHPLTHVSADEQVVQRLPTEKAIHSSSQFASEPQGATTEAIADQIISLDLSQ
jgi:hypothetical protein